MNVFRPDSMSSSARPMLSTHPSSGPAVRASARRIFGMAWPEQEPEWRWPGDPQPGLVSGRARLSRVGLLAGHLCCAQRAGSDTLARVCKARLARGFTVGSLVALGPPGVVADSLWTPDMSRIRSPGF